MVKFLQKTEDVGLRMVFGFGLVFTLCRCRSFHANRLSDNIEEVAVATFSVLAFGCGVNVILDVGCFVAFGGDHLRLVAWKLQPPAWFGMIFHMHSCSCAMPDNPSEKTKKDKRAEKPPARRSSQEKLVEAPGWKL